MDPSVWLKVLIAFLPVWALAQQSPEGLEASTVTQKPEKYSVPLRFTPEDLGMSIKSYDMKWDLSHEGTLKMGPVSIDSKSLAVAFYKGDDKSNPLKKDILLVAWPISLFSEGRLELISRLGTVVWGEEFDVNRVENWNAVTTSQGSDTEVGKVLQNSSLGFHTLTSDILAQQGAPFRFCFSNTSGNERTMLCSPRYVVDKSASVLALAQIQEKKEPRALVNGEAADKNGSIPVQSGQTISFFAETSSGAAYEFISSVPTPEITDIVKTEDSHVLYRGFSPIPVGAKRELHSNEKDTFWNKIGWQQTIGDLRSSWTYKSKIGEPLAFSGRTGGIFIVEYEQKFLPEEKDRLWLYADDVPLTYSSQSIFRIFKDPKMNLKAEPPSYLTGHEESSTATTWNFFAPNVEAYNSSSLTVENGSHFYKTSLEVYRGYSSELSGRVSIAADSQGESLILGEFSYNKWFQSLMGWDSRQWSILRWGVSAKYFKSLTKYSNSSLSAAGFEEGEISFMNLSAKYRFHPGLWGRHETWGAMLDYQDIESTAIKGSLVGGGLFWARSMPRIFDEWLNIAPFFRYPKFVDMELIYYPTSLSSGTEVSNSYTASFHGKIFWTQSVFGEAGFALKSFDLANRDSQIRYSLSLFTLTAGLGINF